MRLGPLLLLMFLAVPLIEVALFIQVGSLIGLWPTLLAIVVTAVVGSAVIRRQGLDLAQRARGRLAAGKLPLAEAFDGLCLVVAGLLMITPGFFTDTVGAVLLVPWARRRVYRGLARRVEAEVRRGGGPPDGRPLPRDDTIVDADYEIVADDPPPSPPPPRGDWGPKQP